MRWRMSTYSRFESGLNLRTEGIAARVLHPRDMGSGTTEDDYVHPMVWGVMGEASKATRELEKQLGGLWADLVAEFFGVGTCDKDGRPVHRNLG